MAFWGPLGRYRSHIELVKVQLAPINDVHRERTRCCGFYNLPKFLLTRKSTRKEYALFFCSRRTPSSPPDNPLLVDNDQLVHRHFWISTLANSGVCIRAYDLSVVHSGWTVLCWYLGDLSDRRDDNGSFNWCLTFDEEEKEEIILNWSGTDID